MTAKFRKASGRGGRSPFFLGQARALQPNILSFTMTNRSYVHGSALVALSVLASTICSTDALHNEQTTTSRNKHNHMIGVHRDLDVQESRPRIYGGEDAEESRYPYYVRLVGAAQCGGALIAPDVVITAAHCEYVSPATRSSTKAAEGSPRSSYSVLLSL